MKSNEFRILGAKLGEADTYIDVIVDGIDEEGTLYFADADSDREWELTHRDVQNLMRQNFMISSDEVTDHKFWNLADRLTRQRPEYATTEFGDENIEEAQKNVFLAAYFETR